MAKSKSNSAILLGYEDELIYEKHMPIIGYWTNKVGGYPDWPVEGISPPNCQLCGLKQFLIVQIYAPLENSQFHRTLYVFCCINPNCWNHNESWTCLRCQLIDPEFKASPTANTKVSSSIDWCTGADEWDSENGNFDNGNTTKSVNQYNVSDYESDDDSCSLSGRFGNINVDEYNANCDNFEKSFGAVGKQVPPAATAEIENEENEVVSIDTPTAPQRNLLDLFQEAAPVPYFMRAGETNQNNSMAFVPFFISVGEEGVANCSSEHVRELIQEYQRSHGVLGINQGKDVNDVSSEEYEKAAPIHGDKMFHNFLSRIQANPGQILRYCRELSPPLLLYPLQQWPKKCQYCNGELIFEMQLLPTLIPKLQFPNEEEVRIEFGTVLIFTCKQSCWSVDDKFREEKVIIQTEKT